MSLILDALKRADRERKLKQAPDLSAIYEEEHLNRRKFYSWFAGASLVALAVLAFIFWPKEPLMGKFRDKAPENAMKASAQVQQLSPENPSKQLPVVEKPVIPPPASDDQNKQPKAKQKSDFPNEQPPKLPENGKQTPSTEISQVKDSGTAIAVRPPPDNGGNRKKLAAQPVKQFVTPGQTKDHSTVSETPLKEAPPSIDTLPEEIKTLLEPLEINVHMYSIKPSERRVFINMHGYREGDTIGETGFRLTEITSNGVVINYGEGKAVLGIKQK